MQNFSGSIRRSSVALVFVALALVAGASSPQRLQADEVARRTKVSVAHRAAAWETTPTNQLYVSAIAPQFLPAVAADYGLQFSSGTRPGQFSAVLIAPSSSTSKTIAEALALDPRVRHASAIYPVPMFKDQFVPTDPYYAPGNPSGWTGMWNLNNTFVPGRDCQVVPAWAQNFTGTNIVIGIIDDGVQVSHPDLTSNISLTYSRDFGQNDSNPDPVYTDDMHGTAVSGIAAAKSNSVGIVGVAPNAKIAGLRVDFYSGTLDQQIIDASTYNSTGTSPAIRVKNHSFGPGAPFASTQALAQAVQDSAAAGTIHVRSAGNARGTIGEDVAKFYERVIPETIVVGGMGSDGLFGSYSNFGASLTCVAPTSPNDGVLLPILTTDRTTEAAGYNGANDSFSDPNYTSIFGFTSAAAPVVSGGMALLVQKRPTANVRYAKHLLARTCKVIDPTDSSTTSDGGWKTNAAGFKFNQNYGWGLVDFGAMINQATNWTGVSALSTYTTGTTSVGAAIPDNNTTGVSRTFSVSQTTPLEEVQVQLTITHTWRGDLEAYLTSPSGTKSRLFIQAGSDDGDNINWTFCSNAFWGENPQGTWTINVRDLAPSDTGTWTSYAATLRMGTLIPQATTISGAVTLQSWLPDPAGQVVSYEIRSASNTVLDSGTTTLGAGGAYSISSSVQASNVQLLVEGSKWLRAKSGSFNLNGTAVSGQNFSLIGGDCNGDNTVDASDYFILSDAYETSVGDASFNAQADLNGDDTIDASDYFILSDSYELSGEQ